MQTIQEVWTRVASLNTGAADCAGAHRRDPRRAPGGPGEPVAGDVGGAELPGCCSDARDRSRGLAFGPWQRSGNSSTSARRRRPTAPCSSPRATGPDRIRRSPTASSATVPSGSLPGLAEQRCRLGHQGHLAAPVAHRLGGRLRRARPARRRAVPGAAPVPREGAGLRHAPHRRRVRDRARHLEGLRLRGHGRRPGGADGPGADGAQRRRPRRGRPVDACRPHPGTPTATSRCAGSTRPRARRRTPRACSTPTPRSSPAVGAWPTRCR